MNIDREQRWQAYVDGELSACEAAEFEATLTEAERRTLVAEVRFERALAERLRAGEVCPDEVWSRARAALGASGGEKRRRMTRGRWVLAGTALATAVLAVVTLPVLYPSGVTGLLDGSVILAATSVEELAKKSETGPGWPSVEAYLRAKGVAVELASREEIHKAMPAHDTIEVIGARQDRFAGTRVTEVLVNCCGKPMKVVLAPRDSRAARRVTGSSGVTDDVQATRTVGAYTAAVVGRHPAGTLVSLVSAADR